MEEPGFVAFKENLLVLESMGFAPELAADALVQTGNENLELAIDLLTATDDDVDADQSPAGEDDAREAGDADDGSGAGKAPVQEPEPHDLGPGPVLQSDLRHGLGPPSPSSPLLGGGLLPGVVLLPLPQGHAAVRGRPPLGGQPRRPLHRGRARQNLGSGL